MGPRPGSGRLIDDLVALIVLVLIAGVAWSFLLLIPVILVTLGLLVALWIGWAFLDNWWVTRRARVPQAKDGH